MRDNLGSDWLYSQPRRCIMRMAFAYVIFVTGGSRTSSRLESVMVALHKSLKMNLMM
jgi:hypothetical protein